MEEKPVLYSNEGLVWPEVQALHPDPIPFCEILG